MAGVAGSVYVVTDLIGHAKIGWTTNLVERLRTLQTGNAQPLRLERVYENVQPKLERDLHRACAEWRVNGEWFCFEGDGFWPAVETCVGGYYTTDAVGAARSAA